MVKWGGLGAGSTNVLRARMNTVRGRGRHCVDVYNVIGLTVCVSTAAWCEHMFTLVSE